MSVYAFRLVCLCCCAVLAGCLNRAVVQSPESVIQAPTGASSVVASRLTEPVNMPVSFVPARSQAVDLVSGMPARLQSVKRSAPYPLVKAGFAYNKGAAWPQLELDLARPGELPVTQRGGVLPVALTQTSKTLPGQGVLFCATPEIALSLDAGPRQHWITRQVKSLTGGLWKRWFSDDDGGSSLLLPDLPPEPLVGSGSQAFTVAGRALELQLKGRLTDQGLVVSGYLQAESQPAVHLLYLERNDCQQAWPDLYEVHRFWGAEEDRTADMRVRVRQVAAGRFVAGLGRSEQAAALTRTARLAAYKAHLKAKSPGPVWKLTGGLFPEQGAQFLSGYFGGVTQVDQLDAVVLVIHVVSVVDTRYTTAPLLFRMRVRGRGEVEFVRI